MALTIPMIGMPQGWEWVIVLLVFLLLFGAAKLPDLARGTGRALRIFKAETKGLRDDEKDADDSGTSTDDHRSSEPRGLTAGEQVSTPQPADDPAKRAHDN
jgi:sec-independent protein translocase protein TatA